MARDLTANPYSADEQRVADYLDTTSLSWIADDPIGELIASHKEVFVNTTPSPTPEPGKLWLPGVNLAGGDFGDYGREIVGQDYIYPNKAEIDYYTSKGMKVFRIPFKVRRVLKPTLSGRPGLRWGNMSWEKADLEVVKSLADHAAEKGAYTILDPHDYGRVTTMTQSHAAPGGLGDLIGRDPGTVDEFAAVWGFIAEMFKDDPKIIFGLMNEPEAQTATEWLAGANAAIAAIRATGAKQLILVPGSYWDGAHSWVSTDNDTVMLGVVDPLDNYAYEVHQYLDGDSSGTSDAIVTGAGSTRLVAFTNWARSNGKRGFLGEFGWANSAKAHTEGDALVKYMSDNRDVWLGWAYWAGGPWWGDYMFSIEPDGGADKPQMAVLSKYMA